MRVLVAAHSLRSRRGRAHAHDQTNESRALACLDCVRDVGLSSLFRRSHFPHDVRRLGVRFRAIGMPLHSYNFITSIKIRSLNLSRSLLFALTPPLGRVGLGRFFCCSFCPVGEGIEPATTHVAARPLRRANRDVIFIIV